MKSFSLEEVAEIEGVCLETAKGWVRSGELVAYSVSASKTSQKRRWRVTEEDLIAFRRGRQNTLAVPTSPRRRKPAAIRQYV